MTDLLTKDLAKYLHQTNKNHGNKIQARIQGNIRNEIVPGRKLIPAVP